MLSNPGTQQMIGRYRLIQLHGQGNSGEVWQAEDTALRRLVAIKLLPPVLSDATDYLHAFIENASIAASLEHPHILPIHDFGEMPLDDEVITYLIMPWISGGSLRDRLRESQGPLSPELSLHYLRQAAEAIDYAHQRGILHRNITSGNMLLQDRDLYVSDFGLARLLSSDAYRSHQSINASTPEYMAPELIEGRAAAASDRYSLAVVAYELFTGRVPFQDANPIAVLLQQLNEAPPPPRTFNPHLPATVERTILRGLAKRGHERHPTCRAFIDELERNWRQRTTNPQDLEATALAPWSKYLLTGLETREVHHSAQSTEQAQIPTPDSIATSAQSTITTKLLQDEKIRQKRARWQTVDRRQLVVGGVAAAVLLAGGGLALNSLLPHILKRSGPRSLITGIPLLRLTGHRQRGLLVNLWNVLWHPTGNYLASGGDDERVLVWDIASLLATEPARTKTVSTPTTDWTIGTALEKDSLAWSNDGQTLTAITTSPTVKTSPYDYASAIASIAVFTPNAQLTFLDDHNHDTATSYYKTLAWSPDGNMIATATNYTWGLIGIWQPSAGKGKEVFKVLKNPEPDADYSDQDAQQKMEFPPVGQYMRIGYCWSHDSAHILQMDRSFSILSWDIKSGKKTKILALARRSQFLPEQAGVSGLFFYPSLKPSPSDTTRFVANNVDVAVIFDPQQQKVLQTLGTNDRTVYHSTIIEKWSDTDPLCPQLGPLAWSPNGRYLAGSYLGDPHHRIFIWDLDRPQSTTKDGVQLPALVFGEQGGHSAMILDLAWSPDGRYLASSSADVTVIIWKMDGTA